VSAWSFPPTTKLTTCRSWCRGSRRRWLRFRGEARGKESERERETSPYEIVVVDDNSTDRTAEVAVAEARQFGIPLRAIVRKGKKGLASAIVAGARTARYGVVLVLDADLSHDPSFVPGLVGPVLRGEVDLAVGSRYAPGGRVLGWPLRRRFWSRAATALARLFCAVRDPLSGYFAARRSLVDGSEISLKPRGYKILFELLARARGRLRVHEVPIAFRDRNRGKSKLRAKVALTFLWQVAAIFADRLRQTTFPDVRPSCDSARILAAAAQADDREVVSPTIR
jgi:glycosyltransferase involved in cell wall biosynthesis